MRRAALYARVSSEHQENGTSLDGQLDRLRRCAQERGYTVVEEVREVHSGADPDRPGLNRLRELARAGLIDLVLVFCLDRFMREATQAVIVEYELERLGVVIEYMDLPDPSVGLAYRLTKSMLRELAQAERERIVERTARGRRDRARSGSVLAGRRPPYGYRLERQEDGRFRLAVDEAETAIVRQIFQWYTREGKTLYWIASELTRLGVPTRADTSGLPRKSPAGRWSNSSVREIVAKAEVYATGTWYYGKKRSGKPDEGRRWVSNPRDQWIAVECPVLIDAETWHAADARRAQNKALARRNTKYPYLVGRRVWCGVCGLKVTGMHHAWRPGGERLYYACPVGSFQRRDLAHKCDLPMFRVDDVDTAVWSWIKSLLLDPANMARQLEYERAERERELQPLRERLEIVDGLLAENRQKLARLLDLYLAGDFDKDLLAERKTRLEATIANLESERANLAGLIMTQSLTDEQVQTIRDLTAEVREGLALADDPANFPLRRQIIDLLDVRVRLAVEDGQKVAYVSCIVDRAKLPIVSSTTSGISQK